MSNHSYFGPRNNEGGSQNTWYMKDKRLDILGRCELHKDKKSKLVKLKSGK